MNYAEIARCKQFEIFTIRQLALANTEDIESINMERILEFVHAARLTIASYVPEPRRAKVNTTTWVYMYISSTMHEQAIKDSHFASPYVLFLDYMQCPPEKRDTHAWRSIYFLHLDAVSKWMEGQNAVISDIDVFSYLIWKGAQSVVGAFDTTAGARAIPFLFSWLPGDVHGSALEVDRINAHDLNNPYIEDRYAHPASLNITRLCELYDAKLYKVHNYAARGSIDISSYNPMQLNDICLQETYEYETFNPGSDLISSVPHGLVVIPSGIIPFDCITIYPKKRPVEKLVKFFGNSNYYD